VGRDFFEGAVALELESRTKLAVSAMLSPIIATPPLELRPRLNGVYSPPKLLGRTITTACRKTNPSLSALIGRKLLNATRNIHLLPPRMGKQE
jgi:hypothetical protein